MLRPLEGRPLGKMRNAQGRIELPHASHGFASVLVPACVCVAGGESGRSHDEVRLAVECLQRPGRCFVVLPGTQMRERRRRLHEKDLRVPRTEPYGTCLKIDCGIKL